MQRPDAGLQHAVTVVCNGGDRQPLRLPTQLTTRVTLLNRPNGGYNIGAWEHGWRYDTGSSHFLFVQDECRILRAGWLKPLLTGSMHPRPSVWWARAATGIAAGTNSDSCRLLQYS